MKPIERKLHVQGVGNYCFVTGALTVWSSLPNTAGSIAISVTCVTAMEHNVHHQMIFAFYANCHFQMRDFLLHDLNATDLT